MSELTILKFRPPPPPQSLPSNQGVGVIRFCGWVPFLEKHCGFPKTARRVNAFSPFRFPDKRADQQPASDSRRHEIGSPCAQAFRIVGMIPNGIHDPCDFGDTSPSLPMVHIPLQDRPLADRQISFADASTGLTALGTGMPGCR
jgi:hypothetical protein